MSNPHGCVSHFSECVTRFTHAPLLNQILVAAIIVAFHVLVLWIIYRGVKRTIRGFAMMRAGLRREKGG